MSLLTPLLWSLLPSQITHLLVPYLSQYLPGIFPPAPPGSPLAARNYRWAFTLVVVGYLGYSFAQGGGADEDWYALLGVSRYADEGDIKKAFRMLSRTHHPDKATSEGESGRWIAMRLAYEVLSDPMKRYAYDRFGPDIVSWKCATISEYVRTGVLHSSGFYLVSAGFMLCLSLLGKAKEGAYWRHILFVFLFYLELSLILDIPSPLIPLVTLGTSTREPQSMQILMLHRIWTSVSIGLSQLAGVWTTPTPDLGALVDQVEGLTRSIATETISGFQSEIVPLLSSAASPLAAQTTLLEGMERSLVEWKIATHPLIRSVWQAALQRSHEASACLEAARNLPLPPSPPLSPVR